MVRLMMVAAVALVAACSGPVQQPKLETGVTASGGGGTQFLGRSPSVGVTTVVP